MEKKKSKKITFTSLQLENKSNITEKIQTEIKLSDLSDYYSLMNEKIVDLKIMKLEPGNTYNIEFYEFKEYKCTYCGRKKKICLLPDKSLNFNKTIIFEELIKKKDLVYNENTPFNLSSIIMKLKTKN